MGINKKTIQFITILCFSIVFLSCRTQKKIAYIQDTDNHSAYKLQSSNLKLHYAVDDILEIAVNGTIEPKLTAMFNIQSDHSVSQDNLYTGSTTGNIYKVNDAGQIDFPLLGLIKVEGMKEEELKAYLKKELKEYIVEDPIITINLLNYRISVLGEVARPGEYRITERSRINLFEAVAMAGDLSIYGKRENVKLMRTDKDNNMQVITIDLTSKEIFASPYFYLQQNDVLYIEPNKSKALTPDRDMMSFWFSLWSMTVSVVSVILLIAK